MLAKRLYRTFASANLTSVVEWLQLEYSDTGIDINIDIDMLPTSMIAELRNARLKMRKTEGGTLTVSPLRPFTASISQELVGVHAKSSEVSDKALTPKLSVNMSMMQQNNSPALITTLKDLRKFIGGSHRHVWCRERFTSAWDLLFKGSLQVAYGSLYLEQKFRLLTDQDIIRHNNNSKQDCYRSFIIRFEPRSDAYFNNRRCERNS